MGLLARVAPKNIEHLREMEAKEAASEAELRKTQLLEQGSDARSRLSNLDRFTMMFPDGREAIEVERDPVSGDVMDMTGRTLSDEELQGGVEFRATGGASELKAKDKMQIQVDNAAAKSLTSLGHSLFLNPDLDKIYGQLQIRGVVPKRLLGNEVQNLRKMKDNFTVDKVLPIVRQLAPVTETDVKLLMATVPGTEFGAEVAKDWYLGTFSSGIANMIQAKSASPAEGVIARNRYAVMSIQDAVRAGTGSNDLKKLISSTLPDVRDISEGALPIGSYVGSNNKLYSPDIISMFAQESGVTADELVQTMGLVKAN